MILKRKKKGWNLLEFFRIFQNFTFPLLFLLSFFFITKKMAKSLRLLLALSLLLVLALVCTPTLAGKMKGLGNQSAISFFQFFF